MDTIDQCLDAARFEGIDLRDAYNVWAEQLARAIATYTGADIGEHSSANNPWARALDAMTDWHDIKTAPQDGTPIYARGRDWGDPSGKLHYVTVQWRKPRAKSDASGGKAWRKLHGDDYACVYLTDWKSA